MISGEGSPAGAGTGSASSRPVLREQIAFAPSTSQAAPDDAPAWLGKLGTMGQRPASRPPAQNASLNAPPKVENPPSNAARPFSPGRFPLPQRELRIKVWEDEDTEHLDPAAPAEQPDHPATVAQNEQKEEQTQFSQARPQESIEEHSEVDDLPTTPMPSTFAAEKDSKPFPPVALNGQAGNAQLDEQEKEDADLPTRPLPANAPDPAANRPTGRPFPAQQYRQALPPQPSSGPSMAQQQQGYSARTNAHSGQTPIVQRPVTPVVPVSTPGFSQATPQPPGTGGQGIVAGPVAAPPVRRKSKMRVVVVLLLLLVLLGGGLAYWIIAYQPFSVPAVTQTSLPFSNTSLGIALHYPQGWTTQLNTAHQTVSFSDANHIDQVNISVTASSGLSLTTFANKEVAQLGLTGAKNLPALSFAGTSWRQVQGSVLVSGATDIETVLVAMHGNRFYTLAQIAPSAKGATYADVDHLFFSLFRSSFQFL